MLLSNGAFYEASPYYVRRMASAALLLHLLFAFSCHSFIRDIAAPSK